MLIEWTGRKEYNSNPEWIGMGYSERMQWIAASVKFWMEHL